MAGSIFEAIGSGGKSGKIGYVLTLGGQGAGYEKQSSANSATNDFSSQLYNSNEYAISDNFVVTDNSGFVQGSSYSSVNLQGYGAFLVSVDDGSGEEKVSLVSVPSFEQVTKGIDVTGRKRFLANVFSNASDYQGLESFVYGFGININTFGIDFFKNYFPQIEWDVQKLTKLISSGCVCCKVISNGQSLSGIVTINSPNTTGLPHVVYVPIPLIVSSFANDNFASVIVKVNNKNETVGGDVVFLRVESSYDEETGEYGIGPSDIESEFNSSIMTATEFVGTTLKKGSCKLFLNKSKRGEIEQILGNIPEIYENSLFSDSGMKPSEEILTNQHVGVSMMAFLQNIVDKINQRGASAKLTVEGLLRALLTIGVWEGGSRKGRDAWDYWGIVGNGRRGSDGAGYNAGLFSFTESSGGIEKLFKKIKTNMSQSNEYYKKIDDSIKRAAGQTKFLLTNEDGQIFKSIYNSDKDLVMTSTVQCLFDENWGKNALTTISNCGLATPLGVAAAIAHSIWKPAYVAKDYASAKISSTSDQVEKVRRAGAAFLKRSLQLCKKYESSDTIESIIAKVLSEKTRDPKNHKNDVARRIQQKYRGWYTRGAKLIIYASDLEISNQFNFSY